MNLPTTTAQWTLIGQNGFQDLHYEESVPIPILGDHDCLIKVGAVSLNYRDLAIAKVSRAVLNYFVFRFFSDCSKVHLASPGINPLFRTSILLVLRFPWFPPRTELGRSSPSELVFVSSKLGTEFVLSTLLGTGLGQ